MPVTDLCSCAAVIPKLLATSALGVVSSNRCFSKVQKTATASTRTGVRLSHRWYTSSVAFSRTRSYNTFIISSLPAAVVAVFGGGGGVESGEICPGGRTSCNVGGTAAARTSVNCSGEMRLAISAMPRAVLA